ncbi:MAG: hypothetical protein U0359_17040 [Byssovorax sp.]
MKQGLLIVAIALGVAASAASLLGGCLGDEATATVTFQCPSKEIFTGRRADGGPPATGVSAYMERRCGTLDCHGSIYRPMRIYGRIGLRDPSDNNVTGGNGTTVRELDLNYDSVCNVAPEEMSKAVDDDGASAEKLIILQKARGVQGHKGGVVVLQGSEADQCLLGWLQSGQHASVDDVAPHCKKAVEELQ